VTGASYGLGYHLARELAKRRINVVLIARSKDKPDALAQDLEKEFKVKTLVISADLGVDDPNLYTNIANRIQSLAPSVLINNAGGAVNEAKKYWNWTLEEEEHQRNLNGTATYRLIRLLLPNMVQRRKGAILNVSSLASEFNMFLAPYGAEKAKINGLTKTLHRELRGADVVIQCQLLGVVDTPGLEEFFNKYSLPKDSHPRADVVAREMLERFGAGGALLVPNASHWITMFMMQVLPEWISDYALRKQFGNFILKKTKSE
jgi:short-subunit dehydrogenase